ncbi:hypothetical protein GCM10011519_23660 [Marmoricola endophyticus]|uniref:LytR/CpsA/Psr regulator C-terminal domain-containing protein n=1 Tax=Marmoricola endophyticus TaxID=2040280 RepID=A0A917BP84_9ACTN|nr:hypothetical protein GCM10011519_23660 [Marmoricola endophyticus]
MALGAGLVLFVLMAVFGWQRLTAPLPGAAETAQAPCQVYKTKKKVVRKEVTVSVYNGTRKSGLADDTMAVFERRNFVVGAVGNAPDDAADIQGVQVRTTVDDDPRAELVAEQFTPKAQIETVGEALGPGIDVILGPDFTKLKKKAPTTYVLPDPERTCVDRATPTAQPTA